MAMIKLTASLIMLLIVDVVQSNDASLILPWDTTSYTVGFGFNSATGDVRSPQCISSLQTKQDASTGDIIHMSFKGVTDTETMSKELDASAGASYGGFGVSVSAHASYVHDQSLSSYEAAYVLKLTVDRSSTIRLDDTAAFDTSLNGRPDLAELCGDAFIERAITGGRFYAVFRTDRETFEKHDGTHVDVKAGGWGAEIEAAVTTAISQSSSSGGVSIDILQIGGTGTDWTRHKAPMTVEELQDKATTFPGDVDASPYPFEAHIVPWGAYFKDYRPTSPFDAVLAKQQMDLLLVDYTAVEKMQSSILYISTHSSKFPDYSKIKSNCLDPLNDDCTKAINAIRDAYDLINANYSATIHTINIPDQSCLPAVLECSDASTPYSDFGNGNIDFLDRHNVNCGNDDVGSALSRFHLVSQVSTHGTVNYDYRCCDLPSNAHCIGDDRYTIWGPFANGHIDFLDRYDVKCDTQQVLSQFQLESRYSSSGFTCGEECIRYRFKCCDAPVADCQTHETGHTVWANGNIDFLDRQDIACPDGTWLQEFKLVSFFQSEGKISYQFTCCSLHGGTERGRAPASVLV